MTLPETTSPCPTFVGGGTGWGPLKALVQELVLRRPRPKARIFISVRTDKDIYDEKEMTDLVRTHPSLSLTVLIGNSAADTNSRRRLDGSHADRLLVPPEPTWINPMHSPQPPRSR